MSKVRSLSGAPLSFYFPRKNHLVRNFYFHCSGLNCKDLCKIRQNGEFSVLSFGGIEKADYPPNSPFALCRGHTDLKSLNLAQRSSLRRHTPLPVRILQWMVVKYHLFRTENISNFCWLSIFYNKSTRFGFDDICTCIYHISCVFWLAAA